MEAIYHFKLISFVSIALVGLVGGYYPLRRKIRSTRMLSLGDSAAAGIFLGAGLIHLLGDSVERWEEVLEIEYPVAYLVAGIGFLVVLTLEKAVLEGKSFAPDGSSNSGQKMSAYMLGIVLSIHSIIAGISLGVEATGVVSLALLVAILAHKGSAAFALSNSLVSSGVEKRKAKRIILFFAFTTPFGILVGGGMDYVLQARAEHIFEAIFDSLAAGTFIYVSTLDVMAKTFSEKGSRGLKVILVTAGFGLMALVGIWT